ncbi:MAG TPA: ABC transporter ATP-binding protein [Rhizobiaceae bacterium]|nr:ABC transporter ATP-binding protein [Rhizobiaceae bacterium]
MSEALQDSSKAGSTETLLLEVSGLAYDYAGIGAVSDCALQIPRGRIVALIGGNGAGKTTSVKMIAGALRPRRGTIRFDGQDITGVPAHRVVELGLALVPEGRLVFQQLTVRENLLLSGHVRRGRAQLQSNLDRVFGLFPRLAERQSQNAGSLSGGEQQMLAIGRGLMTMPRLLILDEPSLGLSPILVSTIFSLARKLNDEGISVLLVEQNVHQTLAIADYAYVLEKGRVVQSGEGRQLLNDPKVKEAYLGLA